jgi:hypothetical protein
VLKEVILLELLSLSASLIQEDEPSELAEFVISSSSGLEPSLFVE